MQTYHQSEGFITTMDKKEELKTEEGIVQANPALE